MADEAARGTPAHVTATAVGNYLAGIVFGFGTSTNDPEDAIDSVFLVLHDAVRKKMDRAKQGAVFVPTPEEVARGGA